MKSIAPKKTFFGNTNLLSSCKNVKWKTLMKKRLPVTNWLPTYSTEMLTQDFLAGITVGLTLIPQALAYATVAALPTEYGLYSSFIGCFVYFFLGSSKDITVGPTAILSLFSQPHVLLMGPDAAVLLAFYTGVVVFTMGVLQMGFIVDFFSYPLTSGFTSAGAVTVAATQFNSLLGIPGRSDEFLSALEEVFQKASEVKLWDTVLGVTTFVVLLCMRQLRKYGGLQDNPNWSKTRNTFGKIIFYLYLGRNALAVAVGMTLGYVLGKEDFQPFTLTGEVKQGFPKPSPPPFIADYNNLTYTFPDIMKQMGITLVFAPAEAILENISIAKAFSNGKSLDATQEMLAIGACNIFGSFFRSMPVTGSFSRTAVNNASGVRTPMGGIFTGVMVLLTLGYLAPAAEYIPKASLAGVIISAMVFLFDSEAVVTLWKTKKLDLIPFFVTLLACLFLGLEMGILVGLLGNLLFVLRVSQRPQIGVEKDVVNDVEVVFVTPYSSLQYPSAEYLREKICKLTLDEDREKIAFVVVKGDYVRNIDATVAKNFKILADDLMCKGKKIIFWNFKIAIKQTCVGIDKNMAQYFSSEDLEELITGSENNV